MLANVVEPGSHQVAAEVIQAATSLDDAQLRVFLRRFAARVRESAAPVTGEELRVFLDAARGLGGSAGAP